MAKYRTETEEADGWTREVWPRKRYKLACCDCGLVHDFEFGVAKILEHLPDGSMRVSVRRLDPARYQVTLKARRNNRATAAMRREDKRRAAKGCGNGTA